MDAVEIIVETLREHYRCGHRRGLEQALELVEGEDFQDYTGFSVRGELKKLIADLDSGPVPPVGS